MTRAKVHEERSLLSRLARGAGWALLAKFIGVAAGLLSNALLARLLSPNEMGVYFLLVSIVLFGSTLGRFGIKQALVKVVAESLAIGVPGRARRGLIMLYGLTSLGTIALGLIYWSWLGSLLSTSIFGEPLLADLALASAIWMGLLAFQTVIAETHRGLHRLGVAVFLDGVLSSIFLAVALAYIWFGQAQIDFSQAVALSVIAVFMVVVLGVFELIRQRASFVGPGVIRERELLGVVASLFVTNVALQGLSNVHMWIAGAVLTASDVALLGAAWKLMMLVVLPLLLVNMTVQPIVSELNAKGDRRRLEAALRGTATLAGMPATLLLLVFVLWGAAILELVYGDLYRDAATVLAVLSVGQLVAVFAGSGGQVLALTGHHGLLMTITLASGITTVSLGILGANVFGLLGLALAVTIGRTVHNALLVIAVRYRLGIWTLVSFRPAYLREAVRRLRTSK